MMTLWSRLGSVQTVHGSEVSALPQVEQMRTLSKASFMASAKGPMS
jgi:hypothetical protein